MHKTPGMTRTIWLRTDRAVIPTNTADWHHLLPVQNALHHGAFATADVKRPEFYQLEIEGYLYYIHIPSRIAGVYLIAAARQRSMTAGARESMGVSESLLAYD
jgi:hypothetical protein